MSNEEIETYLRESAIYKTEDVLEQIEKFIDIIREEKKDLEAKILGFRGIIETKINIYSNHGLGNIKGALNITLADYDRYFGIKSASNG